MATRKIPLYLLDDEAIKKFDAFKLKHGFKEDHEVFAACLNIVSSLDSDERINLSFLRNGGAQISFNAVSDTGQTVQATLNFIDIIKEGNNKA